MGRMNNSPYDEDDEAKTPSENYYWKCINGHEFDCVLPFEMSLQMKSRDGSVVVLGAVNICPICYLDWIGSHVAPTVKVEYD